jgi:hypothetical protein
MFMISAWQAPDSLQVPADMVPVTARSMPQYQRTRQAGLSGASVIQV